MSEEGDNFKLNSGGAETPVIAEAGGANKINNAASATASTGGGGGGGVPEIGGPVWTSSAPPVEDYGYYYNSALGFQQNGYFFQNFGPPPNMGKSCLVYRDHINCFRTFNSTYKIYLSLNGSQRQT